MELAIVIGAAVWLGLILFVMGLCRMAARGDAAIREPFRASLATRMRSSLPRARQRPAA